jgi:putative membrane protein
MRPTLHSLVHLSTLSLVAVVSCRRPQASSRTPSPAAATLTAAPSATPATMRVSQENVVAIILAANNTDLSYARLVPARSSNPEVKAFAQRMLTDHTLLNARINDIAMRDRITAEDNAVSLDFRDHSAARRDILRELEGAKFDSTYIANEVQYHQELLDAISGILIPSTKSGELRDFVTSLRPAVSAHLAHAEQIRSSLASRK